MKKTINLITHVEGSPFVPEKEQCNIHDVMCPNICLNGKVKQEYSNIYSGWVGYVDCKYCKGKGTVTKSEAKAIEKEL